MSNYEKNDYAKAFIVPQKYENLINPTTSLKVGTIFKDLYRPYAKHDKKVLGGIVMCENDLLNEIKKYQFYAVELNLYLDNFPNNSKATNDYKIVSKKLDNLIMDYEKNFGPLRNFGSAYFENPDAWVSSPWPWENY